MIKMSKEDFQKIVDHAISELPNEACGLIAGKSDGENKHIEKVYLLNNIDHSNEHFSLDPKEQLEAIKDMRSLGYVPRATGIPTLKHRQDRLMKINGLPTTKMQVI